MSGNFEPGRFDPARFKEQERVGFNLVAPRYENAIVIIAPLVTRLIDLARLSVGQQVLDVATGPGLVARRMAPLVAPGGKVIGIDIANEAIELARQRGQEANITNLSFTVMDAENLTFADNSFDRVICSLGLIHFPSPEIALKEIYRVLKPGGHLVVTVWGESDESPFVQLALNVLKRVFPPPRIERPSMFRLGNPAKIKSLLEGESYQNVQTEKITLPFTVASGAEYWQRFLDVAGITTIAVNKQPFEIQQQLREEARRELDLYCTQYKAVADPVDFEGENNYTMLNSFLLATGVKGLK